MEVQRQNTVLTYYSFTNYYPLMHKPCIYTMSYILKIQHLPLKNKTSFFKNFNKVLYIDMNFILATCFCHIIYDWNGNTAILSGKKEGKFEQKRHTYASNIKVRQDTTCSLLQKNIQLF